VPLTRLSVLAVLADAERVVKHVEKALDARQHDAPLFLFINFFDAHDPYFPPGDVYDVKQDPFLYDFYSDIRARPLVALEKRVQDEERLADLRRKLVLTSGRRWTLSIDLSEEHLALYRKRYDGCVRHLDAVVGRLCESLRERGFFDNSVIIVLSDHGEAFGEDDFLTHGMQNACSEEATRHVPLAIRPPGGLEGGPVVVPHRVSLADILPTIHELVGIGYNTDAASGGQFGVSLMRYMEGGLTPRAVCKDLVLESTTAPPAPGPSPEQAEQLEALGYVE